MNHDGELFTEGWSRYKHVVQREPLRMSDLAKAVMLNDAMRNGTSMKKRKIICPTCKIRPKAANKNGYCTECRRAYAKAYLKRHLP